MLTGGIPREYQAADLSNLPRLLPNFHFILKSNINTENGDGRVCLNERLSCPVAANFLEVPSPLHTWRSNVSCFEVLDANKV